MKFQVASDIHFEFHRDGGTWFFKLFEPIAENIILAGDIANSHQLSRYFKYFCSTYKWVIYIPGNHELYGSSPQELEYELQSCEQEFPNLVVLRDGNIKEIDGVLFAGGTLWFQKQENYELHAQQLNDFYAIQDFVPWVFEQNAITRNNIQKLVKADIIVTHHLPTNATVAEKYKNSWLNQFFVDPILDNNYNWECPASIWIHGHTHNSADILCGSTRVICNPYGYSPDQLNVEFKPDLVVEI